MDELEDHLAQLATGRVPGGGGGGYAVPRPSQAAPKHAPEDDQGAPHVIQKEQLTLGKELGAGEFGAGA